MFQVSKIPKDVQVRARTKFGRIRRRRNNLQKKKHISLLGRGDKIIRSEGNEKFGQTIYRQLLLVDSFKVV